MSVQDWNEAEITDDAQDYVPGWSGGNQTGIKRVSQDGLAAMVVNAGVALASSVTAEASARASADSVLSAQIAALEAGSSSESNILLVTPSGDTTGATDTAAIKAARDALYPQGTVQFVPGGQYYINDTISVDYTQGSVSFRGFGGGAMNGLSTGLQDRDSGTVIYWRGSTNKAMFELDSASGCIIEGLVLTTWTSSNPSTDDFTVATSGITGIRLLNKTMCRRSEILRCQFWLLERGVHYYDDASNASSDYNMDPHSVHHCWFLYCVRGVVVEQTNVYDTVIEKCSFYGSTSHTQSHVKVVKGHVTIGAGCYFGSTKSDGTGEASIYVVTGGLQAYSPYTENHYSPALKVDAVSPSDWSIEVYAPMFLQSLATLPNDRSVVVSAETRVKIFGGKITGMLYTGHANSQIICIGTDSVYPDTGSVAPDNIQIHGGSWVTSPTQKGVIARKTARILGEDPTLYFRDDSSGDEGYIKLDDSNDRLEIGSTVHGALAHLPFNPRGINFSSASSLAQFASKQRGVVTLDTGSSTTTVSSLSGVPSGMYVFLSPANAAAADMIRTSKCPYASTTNGSNAFVITTADGTNPSGTCSFNWWIA